jgi:class 3 adenylate cyclase
MTETRKLAAILVSDVVGYSRLAGADEDRILARLRTLRSDLIDPTIAVHHGRIVKRTGDGAVVEFRSVVGTAGATGPFARRGRHRISGFDCDDSPVVGGNDEEIWICLVGRARLRRPRHRSSGDDRARQPRPGGGPSHPEGARAGSQAYLKLASEVIQREGGWRAA